MLVYLCCTLPYSYTVLNDVFYYYNGGVQHMEITWLFAL